MKKIAFAGSTELARRLIYYLKESEYGQITGMFDDFEQEGSIKHGHPIIGKLSDIPAYYAAGGFDEIFVAVGYNNMEFRKAVFVSLQEQAIPIGTFIHPSAYVAESATIGKGCIVLINCIVEMNSVLHENIFLASSCFVSHDVSIGPHTYCAPSISLAGNSTIGEGCFIGISTTSINGVSLGSNVQTAAGSVVTKDIPENVLIAGVPAVIKKNLEKTSQDS